MKPAQPAHKPYRPVRTVLRHLRDGRPVRIRALVADDLEQANAFFEKLSAESRYLRFMAPMPYLSPDVMARLQRDLHAERSCVLVAAVEHEGRSCLIGGGRIVATDRPSVCEFSLTILDAWHGQGLGKVLLRELEHQAKRLGYHQIEGAVLTINVKMLAVALHRGFHLHCERGDRGVMHVYKHLYTPVNAPHRSLPVPD
ncbi:MAG: GNAT family N-acetyltransferase [Gammaproteobacteria bacterium]|nr:GNAT family N-acetyltransferase [Gammaproteobacteria bacterium]